MVDIAATVCAVGVLVVMVIYTINLTKHLDNVFSKEFKQNYAEDLKKAKALHDKASLRVGKQSVEQVVTESPAIQATTAAVKEEGRVEVEKTEGQQSGSKEPVPEDVLERKKRFLVNTEQCAMPEVGVEGSGSKPDADENCGS